MATFYFWYAVWILTNQFTFWLGTVRLVAFPVASGLLAHRLTFRFGSLTVGDTMRLLANCNTFGAIIHLTAFIWTFDLYYRMI